MRNCRPRAEEVQVPEREDRAKKEHLEERRELEKKEDQEDQEDLEDQEDQEDLEVGRVKFIYIFIYLCVLIIFL
jgi:hypothetical protein